MSLLKKQVPKKPFTPALNAKPCNVKPVRTCFTKTHDSNSTIEVPFKKYLKTSYVRVRRVRKSTTLTLSARTVTSNSASPAILHIIVSLG